MNLWLASDESSYATGGHFVVDIPNAGYSVEEMNAGTAERAGE
jgi:hypothetical protein